jgi:glycosyltransferase involved in cell wall biosynthesis
MPVACTHHNVESALLHRRARLAGEPRWRRAYHGLQGRLLEREERRWLPRVDLNVAVSDADARQLNALAPSARVETVQNGVDIEHFQPHRVPRPSGCVFVGGTNWFPNRDALHWHATEIAAALRQRHPDTETTWVGHATPEERTRYGGVNGMHLTGYVDDIRPHVHPAACFVVPLRVGGGTRLMVLDAWAMGKAIVSTSVGCEGLRTRPGDNILIADTVEEFVECVSRVLADPALRERLERGGRATVEAEYSWEALGARLRRLYSGLARRPSGGSRG